VALVVAQLSGWQVVLVQGLLEELQEQGLAVVCLVRLWVEDL